MRETSGEEQPPGAPRVVRHRSDSELQTPPQRRAPTLDPSPDLSNQPLPDVRDAASQVAQLQSDMNDIKTMVEELQLERQRIHSVSNLLKTDGGQQETPSAASTQDVSAFVRHVDALVWRTRPDSA